MLDPWMSVVGLRVPLRTTTFRERLPGEIGFQTTHLRLRERAGTRQAEAAMSSNFLDTALANVSRIDLPTMQAAAELQTRVDRKYVVPPSVVGRVIESLETELCVLEIGGLRRSRYESVYFDTPALDCYRAAAHGRRNRVKVRTRSYLDSGTCMLELKSVSARGSTIKERLNYPLAARRRIDVHGRDFLLEHGVGHELLEKLDVTLTTDYLRTTLLAADGSRATIDAGLRCATPDGNSRGVGDLIVLETKSVGHPTLVDRALWRLGYRPEPISKYGTGLAAVTPGLTANKWNRTLRRHFEARQVVRSAGPVGAGPTAERADEPRHAGSDVHSDVRRVLGGTAQGAGSGGIDSVNGCRRSVTTAG